MKKIVLAIDGMSCSACSNGLEKYLNKQDGIKIASVNLVMANALIEYEEEKLDQSKIEDFIQQAGFKSLGVYQEKSEKKNNQKQKILFWIFLVLAIVMMYISMGHMIGLPTWNFLNMHENPKGYTLTLLILTLGFLWYGRDIIKNGFQNLIHKTPNMDTLVAIGVLSSLGYSIFSMIQIWQGNHAYVELLYFESAAIVIFFVKLGRYIDGMSKDKTKEAIQQLVQITPNHARIRKEGIEKEVTIDEIEKGDIVLSRPGEKIAVDGTITLGKAHFDESFLTGESKPTQKTMGDSVIAGSINYDGYIEYQAEKIGKDSTISEIVRLVIEATGTKAPIAKIADQVSGYFVPAVMILAVVTFVFYYFLMKDFAMAMNAFVTILVVACPCSLGLATPLAIVVSEGICAQKGILVKKSETLENAEKVNTVVFDKTGTLTYGTLKIAHILNKSSWSEEELMQIVGSLEAKSTHPISKAFQSYLEEKDLVPYEVEEFEDISGLGIRGKIEKQEYWIGNAKMLDRYEVVNPYEKEEMNLAQEGNSIVYVAKQGEVLALIGVNDVIREKVKEVIREFQKRKIETIMLTGDHEKTAQKIAEEIGITKVIANVLPNEKTRKIKQLKEEGKYVLMCGDGINDSPALASADIGVSVNSGTDIAMDSSDVILTKNDLGSILELIDISKKTIRNIKQNLFWAFFYNLLMIPVAMGIFQNLGIMINPMIASFAMMLSSFTVILNALRLKRMM